MVVLLGCHANPVILAFTVRENAMKLSVLWAGVIAAGLMCSSAAFAKESKDVTIDMKASTCKDVAELDEESAPYFLIWIDGYLSGVTGDTTFSTKEFKRFVDELAKYCAKNPETGLLDAAKKVGVQ